MRVIENAEVRGWPGIAIERGELRLGIVPMIGGRLLSLSHRGEELLFARPDLPSRHFDLAALADPVAAKRRIGFCHWGGDKTWVAPQSAWLEGLPPLDLDAGSYGAVVDGSCIRLESPPCRETGLRVTRRIELHATDTICLEESLSNATDRPVRCGVWNVTQWLRPLDVFLPKPPADVRPYPGEGSSVRAHSLVVTADHGWSRIECRKPWHFKLGARLERGVVLARRPGRGETLVLLRRFNVVSGAAYAHDANAEVYNSPRFPYLEIETHAPLTTLAPGERSTLRQEWTIRRIPCWQGPDAALVGMRAQR